MVLLEIGESVWTHQSGVCARNFGKEVRRTPWSIPFSTQLDTLLRSKDQGSSLYGRLGGTVLGELGQLLPNALRQGVRQSRVGGRYCEPRSELHVL